MGALDWGDRDFYWIIQYGKIVDNPWGQIEIYWIIMTGQG